MAGIAYPSWAYNSAGQAAQIVASAAAFAALGGIGTWAQTPFVTAVSSAPADVGFTNTDIRLQQLLVEMRVANLQLQSGFALGDDVMTQVRADVLANDSSLVT